MEGKSQQQKQGAVRSLSIFTFPIPDPHSQATDHQPLFTDRRASIPVNALRCCDPTPPMLFRPLSVARFGIKH